VQEDHGRPKPKSSNGCNAYPANASLELRRTMQRPKALPAELLEFIK
jgi:hypothetical protein